MKIAVASSGLGHVARGVETWARDSAVALSRLSDLNVTLFAGALHPSSLPVVVLDCLKRDSEQAKRLTRIVPGFMWRWGLKSEYGWEQLSFWWKLWPVLRKEQFDILHVQDPMLAFWCRKFRKLGILKTVEILAHGTEETPDFLNQFDYVQHLAPWHARKVGNGVMECGSVGGEESVDAKRDGDFCIPNFVDTEAFHPNETEVTTDLSAVAPGAKADDTDNAESRSLG